MTKRTETNGQEYLYAYDNNTDDLRTLSSTVDSQTSENRFSYKKGYLTKVEHNGFCFGFSYDALGRNSKVSVGETSLLTKTYETGATDKVTTTYATGEVTKVISDIRGNPVQKTYTSASGVTGTVSTAAYDEVGNPQKLVDKTKGICYHYTYNSDGNVTKVLETNASTGATIAENSCTYDNHKRLYSQYYGATDQTYWPIYESDSKGHTYPDSEVVGVRLVNHFTDRVTRDSLGRASIRRLIGLNGYTLFHETYEYLNTPVCEDVAVETSFVSTLTHTVYDCETTQLQYTYDAAGNIETVSRDGTLLVKYHYDGLNRLVREDNHSQRETYVWVYDVGGNITEKRIYSLTTDLNLGTYESVPYVYKTSGWKDQLVSYNGEQCVYDALGNPTTYRGHSFAGVLTIKYIQCLVRRA